MNLQTDLRGLPISILSLSSAIDLAERRKALQQAGPNPPRTERENHYRKLTWGVMPFTLEVLERAAAAFGIEPRFPFWDKRLVEFCLALPPQQKVHGGWTRIVLRRALADILPVKSNGAAANRISGRTSNMDYWPTSDNGWKR